MFGACYDGHYHAIESQYVIVALKKKQNFRSYMFQKSILKEAEIPAGKFVRLPGINCPNSFFFPYQLQPFAEKIEDFENNQSSEPLKPFNGDNDTRSGSEFLCSFENHEDRGKCSKSINTLQLLNLVSRSLFTDYEILRRMRYEDLRQEFLLEYWNVEKQIEIYGKFLKSSYPMYKMQSVSQYAEYWIEKIGQSTIILTQEFIDNLINRIPTKYGLRLTRRSNEIKKSCDAYDQIKACESDLSLIETKVR